MLPVVQNDPLIDVPSKHEFDRAALVRFMNENVEGCRTLKKFQRVKKFATGQSNPTFLLSTPDGRKFVMRKQPPGKLLKSAHQVHREYQVMSALQNTPVPVPKTYAVCRDKSVIGQDFYIMQFVEGRIIEDTQLLASHFTPAIRSAMYNELIRVMAEIHKVDFRAVGLERFGRIGGYVGRQIQRWGSQYYKEKTREIPEMDIVTEYVKVNVPQDDDPTTLIHGDYRMGNVIWHPREPKIVAVLDWELSTLGHPLIDVSSLVNSHFIKPATITQSPSASSSSYFPTSSIPRDQLYHKSGLPSEELVIADYSRHTGQANLPHWTFFKIFAAWRSACIVEGVYSRGVKGNSSASKQEAMLYGQVTKLQIGEAHQMMLRHSTEQIMRENEALRKSKL